MHDVCLIGVTGSGKGYTQDLMKPSGLDVRMWSARWQPPWLGNTGIPAARFYVRMWKIDSADTIHARMFPYPAQRDDHTRAAAEHVFEQGWSAIDAELDRLDPDRVTTSWWEERIVDPQFEMDRLADWMGVPRWTVPDIPHLEGDPQLKRVPYDPNEPTAERFYLMPMQQGEGPRVGRGPKYVTWANRADQWPLVDYRPGGRSVMDLPGRDDICIVRCPAITRSQHQILDAADDVWDMPADVHRVVEPHKLEQLRTFLRDRGISGRRVAAGATYAETLEELFAVCMLAQDQAGHYADRRKHQDPDWLASWERLGIEPPPIRPRPTLAAKRAEIAAAKAEALNHAAH